LASKVPWSLGIGAARSFASQQIITRWELLPDSYEDRVGIPFRSTPLSKDETLAIFGKGIDANSANRLLSILHGRRVAGTLMDPDAPNYIGVHERNAQEAALEWLRKNVPVDEVRSAGLRAEKELAEIEGDIISDAERIGLYKPNSQTDTSKKGRRGTRSKSVYGKSGLDYIREQKEKALDEKEKAAKAKMSQADEIRYNTGTLEPTTARRGVELRRKGENPWLKYYIERSKILPNTPPDLTMFQRLWPSGLLTLVVVGICLVLPLLYTAPKNSQRMFSDIPPAAATIMAIIALNIIVYAAWHSPPFFRVLNKYFITVPGFPIPASLFGNMFSHQEFGHLAINMFVLFFVGTRLHDEVGRANFLAIYLSSGMLGSFISVTSFVVRNSFVSSALGASGALSGVIAAYLWLNRNEPVTFFGLGGPDSWLVMPCWLPLFAMIGIDVFALTKFNKQVIKYDHWAHIGGYLSGMAAAEVIRARANRRKELEIERRKNLGFIDKIKEGRL
jgi:rhomboid-like protein